MSKRRLVIATRESPLAMRQANLVKAQLQAKHPQLSVELLGMTTTADQHLEVTLSKIGGKGLFVKELEEALLDGRADLAVHSMKDVPMILPPGLCVPVMTMREDPRDVFVSTQYTTLTELPSNMKVGTSSLRRQTQLKALRSDLDWQPLRGNIQTRLKQLDQGNFAGIILAAAGLKRMGLLDRIRNYLETDTILPAAGQGALGLECREEDSETQILIAPLHHEQTGACVNAERAVCRRLNGGCQAPVAAYAEIINDVLHIRGLVANADGSKLLRATLSGAPSECVSLGDRVATLLLEQGAEAILQSFFE